MTSPRPSWDVDDEVPWLTWWRSTPKDELMALMPTPRRGEPLSDAGAAVLAAAVGLQGSGNVSPNPLVGCVVRSHKGGFLAAGAHLKCGESHAEVIALSELAHSELQGAKVTVSLEPCAHFGKTPPCTDALCKLPLAEVRYLVQDPNPRVNGRGAEKIKSAGINAIHEQRFQELGEDIAEIFLFNQRRGEVFLGLKAATTKEGIYALPSSSRQWITGERSRAYGHYLRLRYDAILVGAPTVLLDDPSLNVRSSFVSGRTPLRVVLDPTFALVDRWKDLKLSDVTTGRTLLVVPSGKNFQPLGGILPESIAELPLTSRGHFSWKDIKLMFWQRSIRSLLVEGGGGVWRSAVSEGAVQKFHWFVGPSDSKLASVEGKTWEVPSCLKAEGSRFQLGSDKYYECMSGGM